MNKTLFINATIVTPGKQDMVLHEGAVLVVGNVIEEVGLTVELQPRHKDASIIDVRGRVLMPGLINAHMHLYSTFACGLAGEPGYNFVEILKKMWWKLDRALTIEDVYYSALIPYYRGITSGTTTVIDHHASPYAVKGSLAVLQDAALAAGVRSCFCYEVSDRDGVESLEEGLAENADFIAKAASQNPMFAGMFGLHASMTISEDTLKRAVKTAGELGVGIHVHAAEDLSDQEDCLTRYNCRVVQRFAEAGALGPKSILAHCIHVDDSEKSLLKESGTFVAHNPQSNMNNAVGRADVPGMLALGVKVGLGTDGMTSNMLEEARIAMLIQRHGTRNPTVGFGEAVDMLVRNNAAFASKIFGAKIGVIEPGALADLIVVDHYHFTPLSVANWYGHLLFGVQPSRVCYTMVDGKLLMAEGKVLTLDAGEIANETRRLSPKTWQRFEEMVEQDEW